MKARIKKTGEIVNISEYAKITLDQCDSWGNPIEVKPEDVELIADVEEDDYWQNVRIQTAIAAMQGFLSRQTYRAGLEILAKDSVRLANLLVEELKKK